MADINVDVNLPSTITVDVTSPTQALAANISIPGPQGPAGIQGPSGAIGPSGAVGPSGAIGPSGAVGPSGAIGPSGAVGPSGAAGPNGSITGINNIVYTTGNQTISGNKTFAEKTIFGDSAQGDFLVISGNNFTVYGSGNFTSGLFVNGNAVLTGVNLSSYATTTNLASTGATLNNNINSLSGTLTSNYATINNLNSTGSTLETNIASTGNTLNLSINSLSGTLTSTYATITNLASTGSTLNNSINSLSGTLTGNYATINNLASTGSTLATNLASTGSTLNTTINNLSGYINSTSSNIVFTTGNQTISGVKTFVQDATFGDTGQGDFLVISGNNFTVYGSGNFTSGLFVNSSPVLTGSSNLYATSVNLASTGSTLDTKINNLSGVSVLTFGNQTISGLKTFTSGIDLNNSKLINATPDLLNVSANFNITGTQNSRVILANSPTIITGSIVSGNPIGFNTSIIQISSGQVLITGIGSNVIVSSYNNQFRTAAQYATISILHTGNDGYIMYGNTST